MEKGVIPVTPHIYLTQFMDDNVPEERELALKIGSELDGSVILELADRLISDPGVHIEIGG